MESRKAFYAKKNSSVYKNERLTAIAGAILFVLIIVELIITANLRNLISFHIFVGLLLTGPLVVKMLSTGYRFVRYYTRSSEYVKSGPPKPLLRILAPFLVLTTILVFVSGCLLIKHWNSSLIFKVHAASVAVWLPLLAIHVYAYLKKVPGLVARDLTSRPQYYIKGRKGRIRLNMASLTIGLIAAFVLTPWHAGQHGSPGVPTPLILGLAAAVIAVLLVMVQKIKNKKAKWIVGTAGVAAFSSFVISHQLRPTPTTHVAQAKTTVKAKVEPHKAIAAAVVNSSTSMESTPHPNQTSSLGNGLVSSHTVSSKPSQPRSSAVSSKPSQPSRSTVSSKPSQPSSSAVSSKPSQPSSHAVSSKPSQPSSSTQSGSTHTSFSYSHSTQSSGTSSDRQTGAS